jgi:hypothetical protein
MLGRTTEESNMQWMLFPDNPALSALLLALIGMVFLYAARSAAHGMILALARALANALRLCGHWAARAAVALRERNRTVLLAHGREEVRQEIEREFDRISAKVQRDLGGYPALQRRLLEEVTRVEEDYKKSGEVPPPPPQWLHVVETTAALRASTDGLVQQLLLEIAASIERISGRVIAEHRRAYEKRHQILKGFMPFLRSLEQTLTRVDRSITGITQEAQRTDALIEKYHEISTGSAKVEHTLTSSAAAQFVISALVLAVAVGGAAVNFWLIQRPMSTVVGAGEYVAGGIEASHFAALVIILLECAMGLFLMESLRITHLFARIGALPDALRRRLAWVFFGFLLMLAGVEVALAVMHDMIVHADLLTRQRLSGIEEAPAAATHWVQNIPVAGQMILGFLLPFVLAFAAIALEYFIASGRVVAGSLVVLVLHALGALLRVAAVIARQLGQALTMLYDAVIFLPLLVERSFGKTAATERGAEVRVEPEARREGA